MPEEEQQANENPTDDENNQNNDVQDNNESESSNTSSSEDGPPFHPHRGKILRVLPYTEISSISFDKSYEDSTANGKVEMMFTGDDQKYIYDGVACKLKIRRDVDRQFSSTGIEEIYAKEKDVQLREHYPTEEQLIESELLITKKQFVSDDIKDFDVDSTIVCRSASDDGLYGFVTDVKHNSKNSEVTLKDWGYCLEDTGKKLSFGEMFRSELISEVIKCYGLTPMVDFTGLDNDLLTWTNMKSVGSSSSVSESSDIQESEDLNHCMDSFELSKNAKVSKNGDLPSEITDDMISKIGKQDTNYGKWASGKSAEEVIKGLRERHTYSRYENCKDKCASDTFKDKIYANCADSARLVKCCMDVIGQECIIIHGPEHYYNAVKIDGEWKTCDLTNGYQCKTKTGTNKWGY